MHTHQFLKSKLSAEMQTAVDADSAVTQEIIDQVKDSMPNASPIEMQQEMLRLNLERLAQLPPTITPASKREARFTEPYENEDGHIRTFAIAAGGNNVDDLDPELVSGKWRPVSKLIAEHDACEAARIVEEALDLDIAA